MSTQEVSVSANAQQALARLLGKLKVLDSAAANANFSAPDCCPILYFSRKGLCNEAEAVQKIAEQLRIPICRVDKTNIETLVMMLDDEVARKIPIAEWSAMRATPVEFVRPGTLQVAMANPLDHETMSRIEFRLGVKVDLAIAAEYEIMQVLGKQISGSQAFKLDSIIDQAPRPKTAADSIAGGNESSLFGDDPESPPVVRLVNKILAESVERNASDIHIEPEKDALQVRVRVDGLMQTLFQVPSEFRMPAISRLKLLAGMDIAERRKPQDGRFRIKTAHGMKDLRIATAPTVYGETVVIRILSSDLGSLDFETLGMKQEMLAQFKRLLTGSSRVILVTGPTGSGKTSTLYTGLSSLCDGKRTIVTIEDPIEYRIPGVNQIQVNPKIGLSFGEGLRSIVRQDPDVVMVGEIRDQDTATTAMQVAQTGHLVLSTFHTSSAAAAITRLRDFGVPSYIISSCLGTVIAQRLVRKLCPHCAVSAKENTAHRLVEMHVDAEGAKDAGGCAQCNGTGYSGRTGIYSLLEITEEIREAIRTDKGERDFEEAARNHGFHSLVEAGLEAVANGVTTLEEIERVLGPIQPDNRALAKAAKSSQKESGLQKRKILLVEDDENTRSVLSLLLQHELYDVDEAENGIEGLERVYKEQPELIICDLMMPKMNGMQFIQRLRADSRTRDIPVLMLTAADTEDNEVQLISGGADDFVPKNGDTRVLIARVQRLLARSESN